MAAWPASSLKIWLPQQVTLKKILQINFNIYPKLSKWTIIEGDLSNSTAISISEHSWCTVASPHTSTFCENLFQLRCRSTSDQCSYQGQSIVIKVTLQIQDIQNCKNDPSSYIKSKHVLVFFFHRELDFFLCKFYNVKFYQNFIHNSMQLGFI